MKKFKLFIMVALFSLMLGFSSCNGCSNATEPQPQTDSVEVAADSTVALNVENAISLDRQTMYMKAGGDYRWFETEILLPEFMDAENATNDPVMIVNIFQKVIERGNGYDTYVYKFQHFADGTVLTDSVAGFWIENWPLEDKAIVLKYTEAWDKMQQVNLPTPHSKHVTLRNPIGPVAINTQWIFGNVKEQIWVDAVTGECKNSNPAFPEEKGFKMPLGEWP
jgi:hypothetical protein